MTSTNHQSASESGELNLDHLEALAPCPFCGGTEAFVERADYSSAFVVCDSRVDEHSVCMARGPIAVQDDDGEEIPGQAGAIREWNRRAALANQPAPTVPADARLREQLALKERSLEIACSVIAHQPAQEQAEPVAWAVVVGENMQNTIWITVDKEEAQCEYEASTEGGFESVYNLVPLFRAAQQEPVAAPQQEEAPGADEVTDTQRLDMIGAIVDEQGFLYLHHNRPRGLGLGTSAENLREDLDGLMRRRAATAKRQARAAQLDGGQEGSAHA